MNSIRKKYRSKRRQKFKKKSKKKKALVANSTWSDSDDSSSKSEEEDERKLPICVSSQKVSKKITSYNELYENFQQLLNDSMKLSKSYFALKSKYDNALVEIDKLRKEVDLLKLENVSKEMNKN